MCYRAPGSDATPAHLTRFRPKRWNNCRRESAELEGLWKDSRKSSGLIRSLLLLWFPYHSPNYILNNFKRECEIQSTSLKDENARVERNKAISPPMTWHGTFTLQEYLIGDNCMANWNPVNKLKAVSHRQSRLSSKQCDPLHGRSLLQPSRRHTTKTGVLSISITSSSAFRCNFPHSLKSFPSTLPFPPLFLLTLHPSPVYCPPPFPPPPTYLLRFQPLPPPVTCSLTTPHLEAYAGQAWRMKVREKFPTKLCISLTSLANSQRRRHR